ncbi:DMT family transporter, partial [Streptomyces sp. BpilaLS-43]|uniref:DMT family transporter n=1 Tax=Streptomyces sp. BpilaLS-43 TaxID=1839778 RepID=UPI00351E6E70
MPSTWALSRLVRRPPSWSMRTNAESSSSMLASLYRIPIHLGRLAPRRGRPAEPAAYGPAGRAPAKAAPPERFSRDHRLLRPGERRRRPVHGVRRVPDRGHVPAHDDAAGAGRPDASPARDGVPPATPGAFLVVRNGAQFGGSSRWTGDVRLLVGGPAWAGYNVLGKPASAGREAMSVTYYQTLAGAAGFLLASLLEAGDWRMPGATASCPLGYLAVACSVGGFLLYNYGLRRMPSSVAVNILNPVPAFGVIGAVVINGESVRPAR